MPEFTSDQFEEIWLLEINKRSDIKTNRDYYAGDMAIVDREETYSDGQEKSEIVTNWIDYGVDLYVGALTTMPWQITHDTGDEGQRSPVVDLYREVDFENDLASQDSEILENSLVAGSHVEVHEFVEGNILIRNFPREQFAFARDGDDVNQVAVRYVVLREGTVHEGELLEEPLELMTAWTENQIYDFRRSAEKINMETGERIQGEWEQLTEGGIEHHYGRLPVIEWKVNDDCASFITAAIREQSDEYNDIDSLSGDDIRMNTNSKLVIQGCDPAWLKENAETINALNMLPLPEGAKAEYMTKGNDVARIESRLQRTREHLHNMMKLPDIHAMVGATGDTSGIALKLKFMPMMHRAAKMAKYLKKGMRERLELINARVTKTQSGIEFPSDIGVEIQFVLPVNKFEKWAAIRNLDGLVSKIKQLELLSDVDDPHEELDRMKVEVAQMGQVGANGQIVNPENMSETQQVQVVQDTLDQGTEQLKPAIENLVDMLSEAVLDVVIRNGTIQRALDRQEQEVKE